MDAHNGIRIRWPKSSATSSSEVFGQLDRADGAAGIQLKEPALGRHTAQGAGARPAYG